MLNGEVVAPPCVTGKGAVNEIIEMNELVDEFPYLIVVRAENVRSVFMNCDPLNIFLVAVSADMVSPIHGNAGLPPPLSPYTQKQSLQALFQLLSNRSFFPFFVHQLRAAVVPAYFMMDAKIYSALFCDLNERWAAHHAIKALPVRPVVLIYIRHSTTHVLCRRRLYL